MEKSTKQEMEEALKSFASKNFMFTKSLSEEKLLKEMEKTNSDSAARDALLSIALGIFKTQTDKQVLEEAVATLPVLQEELKRVQSIEQPKDGYTPRVGKDFFTKEQITNFQEAFKKWAVSYLASNRPKDGKDADEEKIIKAVLRAIPEPKVYVPKKGKDYFTPFEVAEIKREVTPAKGVDYFTKKDKKELVAELKKDVKVEPLNFTLFNRDKNLGDLQNVNLSAPTNGQALKYNSTTGLWENGTVSGGSGHTIQDEGTPLTARTNLNFVGANVAVTDDAGNDATVVTISGSGSGDVSKVGTPANNQIGVWTGDGTIEGDANLTWDGTNFNIATAKNFQIAGATILADSAGTTTLSNIDALDATTESTIESAIDTLANLTSIQGRTVTLADAGANAIFGWDDVAGAYENLTAGEATAILNNFVGDSGSGGTKGLVPAPGVGDSGKYLKGDGTWGALAGGGNVSNTGTPANNQIAVWTDATTVEGDASLTFDTTTDTLSTVDLSLSNDLLLASGSIINFNAGDVTITHSSNLLTIEGGNLSLGANLLIAHSVRGDATDGILLEAGDGTKVAIFGASNTTDTSLLGALSVVDAVLPSVDNTPALGASSQAWADLFLGSGAVINFNAGDVTITHSSNLLTIAGGDLSIGTSGVLTTGTIELGNASDTTLSRSAAGVLAVEGVVIPSISSTNTLTNKRVTPRTGTTTSSATPTINTDNVDFYSITAQTVDITSFTTNLSGTPTGGQKLWIAITGTAARAITWGSSFEASTVALPTTTVSTNRLDVGFVWNTVTSKWRCVATC